MGSSAVAAPAPVRLTVLYDETCELCRRCRHWLEFQPTYVNREFRAAGSPEAGRRYGGLPWLGAELVVVSEEGAAWVGPAAFLLCLWATRDWREWSYRLSGPAFAPLAERFFAVVSAHRRRLAAALHEPRCAGGRCHHRRSVRY